MSHGRITAVAHPRGEVRVTLQHAGADVKSAGRRNLSIGSKSKEGCNENKAGGHGALSKRAATFTKHGKGVVRDACAVLEAKTQRRGWLATFTLPGSTEISMRTLAEYASYIVERINQYLRDNHFGTEFVAVWELQKRGALHLHYAIPSVDRYSVSVSSQMLHRMWCRLLEAITVKSGVDMFARKEGGTWRYSWKIVKARVEVVRKSLGRYLSKYMSKTDQSSVPPDVFCPPQWWTCSRSLRRDIASRRVFAHSSGEPLETSGERFEQMTGILSSVAQTAFSITNVFSPGRRCLSFWFDRPEDAANALRYVMRKCDYLEAPCYNATTRDNTTAAPTLPGAAVLFFKGRVAT